MHVFNVWWHHHLSIGKSSFGSWFGRIRTTETVAWSFGFRGIGRIRKVTKVPTHGWSKLLYMMPYKSFIICKKLELIIVNIIILDVVKKGRETSIGLDWQLLVGSQVWTSPSPPLSQWPGGRMEKLLWEPAQKMELQAIALIIPIDLPLRKNLVQPKR